MVLGVEAGEDADLVTASLADRLRQVTIMDLGADEVTARLVEAAAEWATRQGWRVYRRAASVLPLPPPYERQRSVLDVACARPVGPPVVIEVDRVHRQRTIDKLLAESAAGRVAILVRWGSGRVVPPPSPVRLVTVEVTARRAPGGGHRIHSRLPAAARSAPAHSAGSTGDPAKLALPIALPDPVDP
jgi:hypothetical protein